jgi:hypothetical protein
MMETDYSLCSVAGNHGKCGPFNKDTSLVLLGSLRDVQVNRIGEKLETKESISVEELIRNRASFLEMPISEESVICPSHRRRLGTYWRQPAKCQNPSHIDIGKKQTCRPATLEVASFLTSRPTGKTFPIGGALCTNCRKSISVQLNLKEKENDDLTEDNEVEDPTLFQSPGAKRTVNRTQLNLVLETLGSASPAKYQIQSPLLSTSQIEKLKRKYTKSMNLASEYFAEAPCPGQGKKFLKMVKESTSSKDDSDSTIAMSTFMWSLRLAFESAEKVSMKIHLLSLIDPDEMSKKDIQETFTCSRPLVNKAMNIRSNFGPGNVPDQEPIQRKRLDLDKVEDFLNFIFISGYYQDVDTGTTSLKLDNGDEISIPKAIRTILKAHIVRSYEHHCSQVGFEPLSERTLHRILDECKASHTRKTS